MSEVSRREKELGYCEEAQTYCSVAEDRYEQGRTDAIVFAVRQIIYPLLNEYDIQLWKSIEYIELADKWVEFVDKYNCDDESIINELVKWILEQLKENNNDTSL